MDGEADAPPGPELDEAAARRALETLDHEALVASAPAGMPAADVERLLGILRRSSQLYFKYPNGRAEGGRDRLFAAIANHLDVHFGAEPVEILTEIRATLNKVETGYRNILELLARAEILKRAPTIQAAAALGRAARQADGIRQMAHAALKAAGVLHIQNEIVAQDEDGDEFSVDSAVTTIVEGLRITLLMIAHQQKWLTGPNGHLVIPAPLAPITEEACFEVGSMEFLAASWRKWERLEERFRYWGGSLETVPVEELPEGAEGTTFWRYLPDGSDIFDWMANERWKEGTVQNFATLMTETFAERIVAEGNETAEMLPAEALSLQELNAGGYISTVIGDGILTDARVFEGLRLVEWLRGYAALSSIAGTASETGAGVDDRHLIRFAPGILQQRLQSLGLGVAQSGIFLELASLGSGSLDFFDTPLIAMSDGSYLLFGPASIDADAGRVVLSRLNSLGHTLEGKGKAFERKVIELFREKGLSAFTIKTQRAGREYELDVLVPWGEHLFLFECKNRSLSDNRPIQAFNFDRDCLSHVKQVRKHVEGLQKYPDMAIAAGGVDPTKMTIVPCVLFNLPYTLPGTVDGVHITDWSSLSRFFSERYFFAKIPYDLGPSHKILHRTALYPQWNSDEPSPADLLRHLEDPPQIKIMAARSDTRPNSFQLGDGLFAQTLEYVRLPLSVELLGATMGFDASWVKAEQAKVARQIRELKYELEVRKRPPWARWFLRLPVVRARQIRSMISKGDP